ncbi:unnamed protein product [Cylindrotheca closterium]|uniref:Thioredoxin domain-containing protein n=1 Tax=Cylindrotheca closterium TaxID=2856 RepID=A0AAD2FJU6_9STRA|nr:unnamed protein product [Cylindrotheca closterium]
MTLTELGDPNALKAFLQDNPVSVVTFSATWCGPCRSSKPQLEQLASKSPVPIGYVYESDIGDFLHTFEIRAFPTYALFRAGKEASRVEGVNFPAIEEMIQKFGGPKIPESGGNALGGGESKNLSPEEARKLRLAKFAAPASAPAPAKAPAEEETKPAPMDTSTESKDEPMKEDDKKEDGDAAMKDAEGSSDGINPEALKTLMSLDAVALKTLTESMGFPMLRAQKGLLFGGGTVDSAVDWIMLHQDDDDIDEAISEAALIKKKLTPEEKEAKIEELKALMKIKRAEREEAEKVDHVEREKQRRFMGKEIIKTKEQMEAEQRKRDIAARKREKLDQKRERDRIRAELEKDKMERRANKGKLKSSLGVDGYNPSAIQYNQSTDGGGDSEEPVAQKQKKSHPEVSKIDDYIKKVASYRAGGDGGKCLKILKAYVGNVADNPEEDKFKKINMDNKAFKTKVKPFIGAKSLLLAIGFAPAEGDPTQLALKEDADIQVIKDTKTKLEAAFVAFG